MPLRFQTGGQVLVLLLLAAPACGKGAPEGSTSPALPPAAPKDSTEASPLPPPTTEGLHVPLDVLLRAHVKEGVVDYAALKKEEAALDAYLTLLAKTDPEPMKREEKLAYWINAYNSFTLKLILRKYPAVKSIKEIPGRWTTAEWTAGGKKVSLEDIEHKTLRPMGEPRIHFAIVCASKSCPDLASEAYVGSRLDEQLSAAARRFFADPRKGFRTSIEKGWLGGESPTVHLSSILKWFGDDFVKAKGSVLAFAEPYLPEEGRTFLKAHSDPAIRYLDYDWSLNGE